MRAHIIGVSVSDTTAEIKIATASVTANSRNNRPTISPINSSGISTAIRENVNEMIVKPISPAPLRAAVSGFSLFDIARNILDNHNRVIDHKPRGDGQRHQRQVIDREIEEYHYRKGTYQR